MHHKTALSFLKKGYQVIPLSKKTGNPIIKFKDALITEEIITSINWLNCDYALLMRDVWCIDVNTHSMDETLAGNLYNVIKMLGIDCLSVLTTDKNNYGLDGYSSILNHDLKEELISNFKKTYQELTASGGLHVLFKKRPGIDYSQKIRVADGIDIKANDNNYVKIYPSNGREVLQAVDNLPYYDGHFEKAIFAKPKSEITTHYFNHSIVRPENSSHEGREAYERIANGTSYNRNDDLFKATCWALENGFDL